MTASRKRFPQEFKDELCREVINTSKPIKDVAAAYGVGPGPSGTGWSSTAQPTAAQRRI